MHVVTSFDDAEPGDILLYQMSHRWILGVTRAKPCDGLCYPEQGMCDGCDGLDWSAKPCVEIAGLPEGKREFVWLDQRH